VSLEAAVRPTYKWRALGAGGVYIGGATVERATWPLLLPIIRDDLGVGTSEVVWIVVMFALGMAGSTLTVGHLGDKLGHKRIATIGLVLEGSLLLAAAVSPVFWPLLILRLFQGMGAAMALNNLQALTVGAWPQEERGRLLGYLSALPSFGLIAGPIFSGFVAHEFGWRWAIAACGVHILSEAFIVRAVLREDAFPQEKPAQILKRMDWAGSFGLLAAIACLIVAGRFVASESMRPYAAVLFPVAVLGFAAVIWQERRSTNPVLNLQLFTRRTFAIACSGMVLFSLVAGANTFLFPFYLQNGVGWSVAYTGSVIVALSVPQPFGAPISGRLADQIGSKPVQFAGIAVLLCGLLLASQLGRAPETWHVVLVLLTLGLGASLYNPANNRVIYGEVPRDSLGTASAISASGRYVGQSLGAALAAALLVAAGDGDISGAFVTVSLMLAAVLGVGMVAIYSAGSLVPRVMQRRRPVPAEPAPP
jgi:MFS family permease